MKTILKSVALGAALILALTACGPRNSDADVADRAGGEPAGSQRPTLTVLAAASLKETFTELGEKFKEDHPDTDIVFSFESSATLAQQVSEGAPAGVLATADRESIDSASRYLRTPITEFAQNELVLVVPKGNPADISGINDLAGSAFVTCVETAPCGKLAKALLAENKVTQPPVSLELDVKATLAKVSSGEADAGLVYASDAKAASDDVESIAIPGSEKHITGYFMAPLKKAKNEELAADFVTLVTGPDGQAVLADAGFKPAP